MGSFEENFLYPFYLVLVAGLISGILIPTFHRIQENRQKKLELEREERQRRIELDREERQRTLDREREDHKNELLIKNDLIEKIAKSTSTILMQLILDMENPDKKMKTKKFHIKIGE